MPFRDAPFAPLQGVGMRPEGLLEGEGDVTEGYNLLGVGLAAPEGEVRRGGPSEASEKPPGLPRSSLRLWRRLRELLRSFRGF